MFCPNCKTEYPTGKFCPECGCALESPVVLNWCPTCKREVNVGKFCSECGSKLVAKPVGQEPLEPPGFSEGMESTEPIVLNEPIGSTDPFEFTEPIGSTDPLGLVDTEDLEDPLGPQAPVERDPVKAAELFTKARNLEFGIGMDADMERAAKLYREAAKLGNADAMCHVGYLALFGFGIARDTSLAIQYLEQGLSESPTCDSIYCQNAQRLLEKIRKAPQSFAREEDRYPVMLANIDSYNEYATKHGYKTLEFNPGFGFLLGTGVDSVSVYCGRPEKQHYLNQARTIPRSAGKKSLRETYQEAHDLGYLGSGFIGIIRELIALGLD